MKNFHEILAEIRGFVVESWKNTTILWSMTKNGHHKFLRNQLKIFKGFWVYEVTKVEVCSHEFFLKHVLYV